MVYISLCHLTVLNTHLTMATNVCRLLKVTLYERSSEVKVIVKEIFPGKISWISRVLSTKQWENIRVNLVPAIDNTMFSNLSTWGNCLLTYMMVRDFDLFSIHLTSLYCVCRGHVSGWDQYLSCHWLLNVGENSLSHGLETAAYASVLKKLLWLCVMCSASH